MKALHLKGLFFGITSKGNFTDELQLKTNYKNLGGDEELLESLF